MMWHTTSEGSMENCLYYCSIENFLDFEHKWESEEEGKCESEGGVLEEVHSVWEHY